MSIVSEFKEFAVKGNPVEIAVGIVVGAAFGNITNSLVNDIIMPPIGYLTGGMEFKNLAIILKAATADTPEVAIRYGQFVNSMINFLVIAICMFFTVKFLNTMRRKKE